MLIAVSEALETPVSTLLSENIAEKEASDLKLFQRNWSDQSATRTKAK